MSQQGTKQSHQEANAASFSQDRQQQQQQITKSRPATSTSSIISLSKLKSYMPQNNVTSKLFPCLARASIAKPVAHMASLGACYRKKGVLHDPSSSSLYSSGNHENLARARVFGSSPSSNIAGRSADRKTPTQGTSSGYHQQQATTTARPVNQVVTIVAHQELEDQAKQQRNSITDLRNSSCSSSVATICSKTALGAESSGTGQHNRLLNSREQRERKKIGFIGDKGTGEDKEEEEREQRSISTGRAASYKSRNNMTPSSLLLLHNHSYAGQQYHSSVNYNNDDRHGNNHQDKTKDISIEQSASASENCSRGTATKQSDNQPHEANYIESSPSSSLMLPQVNQFKALNNVGNSSINNDNSASNIIGINTSTNIGNSSNNSKNNSSETPRANLLDPSDYLTSHNLNRAQVQGTDESTSNISNLQQSYQQSLPIACNRKVPTGVPQFVQYSAQNHRQPLDTYQTNFPATMLEQQIKLENGMIGRGIFEENNSISIVQNNTLSGNSNVDSVTVGRDLAQQRAMTSINQYYNNHYNILMPTPSSKSSSPASTTSTPSPKMNAMHLNTSQNSNQIVPIGGSNSSVSQQAHVDNINHGYMSSNIAADNLNHQQQQLNQHYSYNPHATGVQNQQIAMSDHDQQAYTHHHHQHHPHQQDQQQLQHVQQQSQQQNHQQHHQQQQQHQSQHRQMVYHHLANNAATMNVNQIYANPGAGNHYQGHLQSNVGGHQSGHLMSSAHQNQLNTAAAARAAAAVVSQTLKTVAHQHGQQHNYGGAITNGFSGATGNFMNMSAQHHQQFHSMNSLNHHHHHLNNQNSAMQQQHHHHHQQQQQQIVSMHHTPSVVTRKYQCKMCPQVFMSKAEMKYHNQNHMREAKPYKCLQCPKAFANSSYLSQHMRIHQGVKPYTCDICSRKFTQLSHLQQHKRTHTGDKPYKCNYMNCTKQFSQLSNLQSHSRCHQLDKPYKCNSCYKCFHDEQSLLEHIPRHLESKHLKKNLCIFCGSSYQQERGLVKHFQQYHTDKSPTLVAAAIAAGTTGNTNLIASLVSSNPSNAFVTPANGVANNGANGSSSSSNSSTSSVSSTGSLNLHNNLNTVVHGSSTGEY